MNQRTPKRCPECNSPDTARILKWAYLSNVTGKLTDYEPTESHLCENCGNEFTDAEWLDAQPTHPPSHLAELNKPIPYAVRNLNLPALTSADGDDQEEL